MFSSHSGTLNESGTQNTPSVAPTSPTPSVASGSSQSSSVPSSPPPVYIGIQAAQSVIPQARAGIGDNSTLYPPPLKITLLNSTPSLSTAPDDPTLPRVDHLEYRMSSFDRSQGDAAFRVQELADILDHELKDCTFDDPGVIKKLFTTDRVIPIEKKQFLQLMKKSEAYIPDFIKKYDPSLPANRVIAAPVINEEHSESDDEYIEGKSKPKKKGTSDEDKLVAWTSVIKIDLNLIAIDIDWTGMDHIAKEVQGNGTIRAFDSKSSTVPLVGDSKEKRKPDLILLARGDIAKGRKKRWPFALVAIEYTAIENFPPKLMRQMAQRAALMLHNCPGRRFAPLMAISGAQFIVCVYHRSGVNISPRYDIYKNRYVFYNTLAGFYLCNERCLGYDPNVKLDERYLPYSVQYKGLEYKIIKKLDVKEGIQGRGTVCWIVQHPLTGKFYSMKLSWIEKTVWADLTEHETEVAYYEKMNEKRTKGVPRMVSFEDTIVNKVVDTTGIWNTKKAGPGFRERTYRKVLLDGIGKPLPYFRSLKELMSAVIDICKNHGGLYFVANLLHMDLSLRNMLLIDEYPADAAAVQTSVATNTSRASSTIPVVSTSQATSLSMPSNMSGSTAAATGFGLAGSTSGAAISTKEDTTFLNDAYSEEDERIAVQNNFSRGLIIDFDFAAIVRLVLEIEEALKNSKVDPRDIPSLFTAHERRLRMRTGTLPYMAIQVLLGCSSDGKAFPHTYQNDLESLIYGLMKMCIYQAGPNNTKRDFKKDPIPSVYSGTKHLPTDFWVMKRMTWAELGFMKTMTWTHLDDYVVPCMHKYFHELVPMFRELRDALFPRPTMPPADYERRINSTVKYATILRIFRKYRDLLPDEAPLDPPIDPYPPYPEPESDPDGGDGNNEPRRSGRLVDQPRIDYNLDNYDEDDEDEDDDET